MKYPISPEFGLFAHLHAPICRPLLPVINSVLSVLPVGRFAGVSVRKLRIPTPDGGRITARLFEPENRYGKAPCVVDLHGGGFVMQAAPNHFALAAEYAARASCRVIAVRYRLAPRHKFPTPFGDCFAAYLWVRENADTLGVDASRIAVLGDSAGGCLSAAVCQKARDGGVPLPCMQLLFFPVTDRRMQTASMRAFPDTPMWNARLNARMWRWYLPDAPSAPIAYASPAEAASLAGLPPAYIETAEFDCLRDEGVAYALALREAGVEAELVETTGTMHGYDGVRTSPTVQACMDRRVAALLRAFSQE